MFILEPTLRFVDLQGRSLTTLAQSINQPMVAASDYPAEETQAFVFSLQNENRTFETYIYLHLLETNQAAIYRFSDNPFSGGQLEGAENEALEFVESMGFMMDNLRFNKLPAGEQEILRKEIPIFYRDLGQYETILSERRQHRNEELDRKVQELRQEEPEEPNLLEINAENAVPLEVPPEGPALKEVVQPDEVVDLIPAAVLEPEARESPSPDETQRYPTDDSLVRLFEPAKISGDLPKPAFLETVAPEPAVEPPEDLSRELNELAEMEAGLAKRLTPESAPNVEERGSEVSTEPRAEFQVDDQQWRVIFGLLLNL